MANTKYKIGVLIDAKGAEESSRKISKVDSSLNSLGRTAATIGAGIVAGNFLGSVASSATDASKAVLNFSSDLEQIENSFAVLTGSVTTARQEIEKLQNFTKGTPFNFEDFSALSQRLQNAGEELSKVPDLMTAIGNAAAATGKVTSERLEGIGVAISQILSKGKVSAEEMEQLAERNVPAWRLLSEQLNLTQTEARKLAENGKISADQFLEAFKEYSNLKWGDAMAKQADTFQGSITRITNAVLIASEKSFAPYFENLSQFASDTAKSLEKQEKSINGVFQALGESSGRAFRRGYEKGFSLSSLKVLHDYPYSIGESIGKGLITGFNAQSNTVTEVATMARYVDDIKNDIKKTPSVADKLEADIAKKHAEDLAKTAKNLSGIVFDLANEITFYGNSTREAATAQRLFNTGISDFTKGEALLAINMAKRIDQLDEIAKKQKGYNDKLEQASDYLKSARDNARFDAATINASEVQKLDYWVKQNAANFKELTFEIKATRAALAHRDWMESFDTFTKAQNASFLTLNTHILNAKRKLESLRDTELNTFQPLIDFAQQVNLKGIGRGAEFEAISFAQTVEGYLKTMKQTQETVEQFRKMGMAESADAIKQQKQVYTDARQSLLEFLEVQDSVLPNGTTMKTFFDKGSGQAVEFIDKLEKLVGIGQEVNNLELAEKLKGDLQTIDSAMASLGVTIGGFGAKTELEKLTELLTDPAMTVALEARAKVLNMTAEQLRKVLIEAQKAKDLAEGATRPRIVGEDNSNPFSDGFFGAAGLEKIKTEADFIKSVYKDMGSLVGGIVSGMIEGVGGLVEAWVLYGELGPDAVKKMLAQVLASISAEAAVLAIFELAKGFAALFLNPAEAAAHFKAAALFGTVAVGAGLAGRAVAGDSFQNDRNSSGSSTNNTQNEDYIPITANRPAGSNGFVNSNATAELGAKVALLARAVNKMNSQIDSMKPGDVLTRGIKQKKGLISDTNISELKKDASKNTRLGKVMRLK